VTELVNHSQYLKMSFCPVSHNSDKPMQLEKENHVENQMVMHVWLWLIEVAKNLSCVELIF